MIPVALASGEQADLVSLEGERALLVSPRAFAPGQPLRFTARLEQGDLALDGKTAGSRRRPDGRFDVRLRMVGLRRHERALLEALLAPATP